MKRIRPHVTLGLIVTIALIGATFVSGTLEVVETVAPPAYSVSFATVQSVKAAAWMVFDVTTGEVLFAHEAKAVRPIASLTKLATAAALYESDALWSTITITAADVATLGRAGKLRAGETYVAHTLLFPLLLESSNDAAVALERTVPELRTQMRVYGERLGLDSTTFMDTSGLSAGNTSTPEDVANMVQDIYTTKRHIIDITGLPSYLSPTTGWINNNVLIAADGYVGGKNGYTPEAGTTMIALFDEALPGGHTRTIGYILLATPDVRADIATLRDHVATHVRYE